MSCASSAEDVDDDDDKRVLFTFFAGALRRLFLRPMVEDIIALLMLLLLLLLLILLDIIIIFLPSSLLFGRGSAESNLSGALENCGGKEEEEGSFCSFSFSFSSTSFSLFLCLFFGGETKQRFVCALVVRRGNNASTTAMTLVANDIETTKEKRRRRTTTTMRFICVCVCVCVRFARIRVFLCKSNTPFLEVRIFGNRAFPSHRAIIQHKNTRKNTKTTSHPTQEQQQRRRDDFIDYHIAIENIHALLVHLFLISRCSSHYFCHHQHHQHQDIRVSSPTHDFCLTPPSQ